MKLKASLNPALLMHLMMTYKLLYLLLPLISQCKIYITVSIS